MLGILACLASGLPAGVAFGQRRSAGDAAADGPAGAALERLRRLQRPTPVDAAVDRGLEYLRSRQRFDGSLVEGASYRNALTALTALAFLSRGHLPDGSRSGRVVRRALDFLLEPSRQDGSGYFGDDNFSRGERSGMYGQGIVTLLLAELLGMAPTAELEMRVLRSCRRAIDAVLLAQAAPKAKGHEGGWRYTMKSPVSDLSVTVWQVMALRAARNAGLDVPRRSIDDAVTFIRGCFDEDAGGFGYQPGEDPIPSTVAAGLFSLQVCGRHDDPQVRSAADWLGRRSIRWTDRWFYYGVYYHAQAMHQLGGDADRRARELVSSLLLPRQSADGSWPPPPASPMEMRAGPVYRTAIAVLALSVEYCYLPIYQR